LNIFEGYGTKEPKKINQDVENRKALNNNYFN